VAETAKLVNRIREISESLLCRDGVGHYCPNCGSTTFEAAMSLKLLADQIGSPVETSREPPSRLLGDVADYLDEQIDALVECHTTPDTNDTDPEVMDEANEVRGWIAQLRARQEKENG